MSRPSPVTVYHFTRVEHLVSIIESGLQPDSTVGEMLQVEVGNAGIKSRRASRPVTVDPGGYVGDYAPFYFAPRSPMMYSIHRGNVPNYVDGCARLIYLVTTVERLDRLGATIVLSDRNAVYEYAEFRRFRGAWAADDFIDWPLMRAYWWNNTPEDPDRMERRMAECLVHEQVPWGAFTEVHSRSRAVATEANQALEAAGAAIRATVSPQWYF